MNNVLLFIICLMEIIILRVCEGCSTIMRWQTKLDGSGFTNQIFILFISLKQKGNKSIPFIYSIPATNHHLTAFFLHNNIFHGSFLLPLIYACMHASMYVSELFMLHTCNLKQYITNTKICLHPTYGYTHKFKRIYACADHLSKTVSQLSFTTIINCNYS